MTNPYTDLNSDGPLLAAIQAHNQALDRLRDANELFRLSPGPDAIAAVAQARADVRNAEAALHRIMEERL